MERLRRFERADLEQAWLLDRDAFHAPAERRERFLALDPARFVGAFDGARLVGIAGAHPMRQLFGGRALPIGGVHSVAVAPDRRGRGLGKRLMAELLADTRERGEALATLFPATTRHYRALGFELAGTTCWRRVAPRALELLPRPEAARVLPLAADEIPRLAACYAEVARDAGLALWGLLASWAPQVETILYRSTAEDPLLFLLPEQELGLVAELRWMSRMLDPAAAVAARGFAEPIDDEAHLELVDPLFPANAGRRVLRVAKGRGELAPGGRGDLRLDAGAFASLFTGYATPDALARAGRLAGASGASRAALAAAFAGPTPWMLDQF